MVGDRPVSFVDPGRGVSRVGGQVPGVPGAAVGQVAAASVLARLGLWWA